VGYVVALMISVELHRAHATPVACGHPWVFAQAVAKVHGAPQDGDEVVVRDPFGKALGRGFWSAGSAISVRLLTRDAEQAIDAAFVAQRVRDAIAVRRALGLPNAETSGYRLIHAEGDGLSGLIADVYGDDIVLQLLTEGMARRADWVIAALNEALAPRAILATRPAASRPQVDASGSAGEPSHEKGERPVLLPLHGETPEALRFVERGLRFSIPVQTSQKTGYYFDQREHRAEVERCARGREVLDACSYVGGFALAAARGGARSVLALDSSQPALEIGAQLLAHNQLTNVEFQRADVRNELARLHEAGRSFDMVVFDPPKFVPTAKHLERGRRIYRKLNAHAIALTRKGGLLVTCSCSAAMSETDFLRMLALASGDVGRELCVLRVGKQGPDHPLLPGFGEGSYLKTVFAVVR
jgi:23S rRNA (cytosine1962-C5)-methyltransferase